MSSVSSSGVDDWWAVLLLGDRGAGKTASLPSVGHMKQCVDHFK